MRTIWDGVNRLLDDAESAAGVTEHGLQLLAIRRWRETGRAVPPAWLDDQRRMAAISLSLPGMLTRIRDAVVGPIVLMKGPELAELYPHPALRPYGDLDLLVEDAGAAQRALIELGLSPEAGHVERGYHYHLATLAHDAFPLRVEVHRRPNWVSWLSPPPVTELLAAAVPSRLDTPGFSALDPVHHALAVCAHAWNHGPLLQASHLLDIALLARRCDPDEVTRTAERWGIDRIWRTSSRAADSLLLGEGVTLPLRLGGRHLTRLRERSVAGLYASRLLGTLWAPTSAVAARALWKLLIDGVRPRDGESWRTELPHLVRLARAATHPVSDYRRLDR